MDHDIVSFRQALALVRRVWREAAAFFFSIELGLMLLVTGATVGGVWLAVMGDLRCLLAFGAAGGYLVARTMLHQKRILSWPFL